MSKLFIYQGDNMVKLFKELQPKHGKGFTLFEVLIVVLIMGVLATIALPTYNRLVRKSRVSDGLNVLNTLTGAQEKYFMEHGFYAQNINELKVPFKETRPGGPYEDVVTTNFTYKKDRNCIRAVSNVGVNYTLVKNFKTKEKVVCMGEGCVDVAEFVEEVPSSQYAALCPIEEECLKNQNICGELHFWPEFCDCKCKQEDYIQCVSQGYIFNYDNCSCNISTACDEADKPECTLIGDPYRMCDPCPNKANNGPLNKTKGINPKNNQNIDLCYHCGYQKISKVPVCDTSTGEWHCQNIYDSCVSADDSGIQDFKDCDGTDLGLGAIVPGNTCGEQPLVNTDCQVPGDTPTAIIIPNYGTCELKTTSACFDGQVTTAGCPPGESKTCVDCQWGSCQSACPTDQTVYNGSQFMACHTLNGVTDPNLYCGTMTATKKCDASTGYQWEWDFSNSTCEDVTTVNKNGIQCGAGGCGIKQFLSAECSLYNGKYIWQNYQYSNTCEPRPGADCLTPGESYANNYYCMHNCRIAKCTNGSVYNAAHCYMPERLTRNGYTNGSQPNPASATICMQGKDVLYGANYNCPQNPMCEANNYVTNEANITTKADAGDYCKTTTHPGELALKVYSLPLNSYSCSCWGNSGCPSQCNGNNSCPRLDRKWSTVYKCTENADNYHYLN